MSSILVSVAVLSVSLLLTAAFLAWLATRLYALDVFLFYGPGRIRMSIEIGSPSKSLLTAFMRIEEQGWHAGLRMRKRSLWQRSWIPAEDFRWRRMIGRAWDLWNHPARPAWIDALWRLLQEIYSLLRLQEVRLNFRIGLSTYPRTGCLAAAAYPLNFTLFRIPKVYHAQILPDFSSKGFSFENHIRCTFRGYQLVKPGYRFLSHAVVQDLLKSQWARKFPRLARLSRR